MRRNIGLLGVFSMVLAALLLARVFTPGGTAHGTGTSMFGDGSDGPITFSSNTTFNPPVDAVVTSAGGTNIAVTGVTGSFVSGQKIMIHQTRGSTTVTTQPN